jgi:DHA1 family tetracycline resistance protein-like MFS transporter
MSNKKIISILFAITAINQLEIGVMLPLAPLLFVDDSNWFSLAPLLSDASIGFLLVGLLFFSYSFAQFISAPFLGALSDSWGRKPVLLVSAVTILVGHTIFLLGIFHISLLLLFVGRIVAGLGDAVSAVLFATVSDISEGDERIKAFGVISSASGIGVMIGAGLYLLADYAQLTVVDPALLPFATLIVLSVVNILLIIYLVPETAKERVAINVSSVHPYATFTNIVRAKHIRYNLLLIFWFIFSLTLFTSFTPTYLTEIFDSNQSQTAAIILVFSLLIACSQAFLIPLLIKRISKLNLLKIAFLTAASSVFALTQITTIAAVYLLLLPTAIAIGILYVTLLSSVSLKSTASQQGRYMGAAISTQTLAQMVPGVVIAASAYQFGVTAPLYVSAFLFCLAAVFMYRNKLNLNE